MGLFKLLITLGVMCALIASRAAVAGPCDDDPESSECRFCLEAFQDEAGRAEQCGGAAPPPPPPGNICQLTRDACPQMPQPYRDCAALATQVAGGDLAVVESLEQELGRLVRDADLRCDQDKLSDLEGRLSPLQPRADLIREADHSDIVFCLRQEMDRSIARFDSVGQSEGDGSATGDVYLKSMHRDMAVELSNILTMFILKDEAFSVGKRMTSLRRGIDAVRSQCREMQ